MAGERALRSEHAVHGVVAPADEWGDGPTESPDPVAQQQKGHFAHGQWFAVETVDDDVVSVPRDDDQGSDLAVTAQCTWIVNGNGQVKFDFSCLARWQLYRRRRGSGSRGFRTATVRQ